MHCACIKNFWPESVEKLLSKNKWNSNKSDKLCALYIFIYVLDECELCVYALTYTHAYAVTLSIPRWHRCSGHSAEYTRIARSRRSMPPNVACCVSAVVCYCRDSVSWAIMSNRASWSCRHDGNYVDSKKWVIWRRWWWSLVSRLCSLVSSQITA